MYIGIDLGTSGVKVILLNEQGEVVASQTEKLTVFFIAFHSLIPSSTHCSRPAIPADTPRSNRAMTIISAACTRFLRIQQMSKASSSVNSC